MLQPQPTRLTVTVAEGVESFHISRADPVVFQDAIVKNNGLALEIRNLLRLPEMKDDEDKGSIETSSE